MRTTNIERNYIDFVSGGCGVRVWRDRARAVKREGLSRGWVEHENIFMIPIPERVLALQSRHDAPARAIARNIEFYESRECDSELGRLLRGQMTFDKALSAVPYPRESIACGIECLSART